MSDIQIVAAAGLLIFLLVCVWWIGSSIQHAGEVQASATRLMAAAIRRHTDMVDRECERERRLPPPPRLPTFDHTIREPEREATAMFERARNATIPPRRP